MRKQSVVTYPALLTPDENNTYNIEFPDVPEALSFGNSMNDAVIHAQEALGLALFNKSQLPTPTEIQNIKKTDEQTIVLVTTDLNIIKNKVRKPTVRKNVTVPADLAEQAQKAGINFSATLSEALAAKLNI